MNRWLEPDWIELPSRGKYFLVGSSIRDFTGVDFRQPGCIQRFMNLIEPLPVGSTRKMAQVPLGTGPDFRLIPDVQLNPNLIEPLPVA